ncbi:serine/threonine-protein kinase [Streptomyces niveus]|uniref:serine/threonine-protein kinase n=1 Tax=Streptomyces niveus TaxID=193462 RepID=UPI00343F4789
MDALRAQDPPRIGDHVLLARIGAGGMGVVYLGRSPGGRLVAVKVVWEEITGHPEALARFRREAKTVRAVRSAYTANLIDAGLDAAPYWIATEYVAGPTLARAVRERGPFPVVTCRRLVAAMAEGLASVHAYGVTHRDLKPQNVLLGTQGPQLIDFGIARGVEQTALTQDGQAPGTPGFAAPEVLTRNEVGAAADVFALGATVAYAATGRAPFGDGDAAAVSYRAVHEEIDTAGVEPGLAALIRACVGKDPARRPGPAELIRWCAVDTALVDDPAYRPLAAMADVVPDTPQRPPNAPVLAIHDLPTQGPPPLPPPPPSRSNPWLVAAGPPGYIQDIGTTRHAWNGLRESCKLPVEVKPPHLLDTDDFGYVSKATDLYEGDETRWKNLLYPDDFSDRAGGKVRPAPPLADDPGEWTVVYHHATSDKNHRSVVCHGFMADAVSE